MIHVRFAAAPTGYLHAGNARQAIVNFLFARAHDGRLTLRIGDTDGERARPEYEAAIEQDLTWLGIGWDAKIRQSDRRARYAEAADRLKQSGHLYPCFESEEELAAKRALRIRRKLPPRYDRAMLSLTQTQREAAEAKGKTPYWRFKLADGVIAWQDRILGARDIRLDMLSDPVVIRADGTPLDIFTSMIDDLDLGITHVIRGEDHVTDTSVQIALGRALAPRKSLPEFAHLPLIVDAGGKRAKSTASIPLRTFRRDGIEPSALAAYLGRLGTSRDPEPLTLAELAPTFRIEDFARGAPRFDPRRLLTLNRDILRGLSYRDVADRLPEGATEAFWNAIRGALDLLSESRLWWRVTQGSIDPPDLPEAQALLRTAIDCLPDEPWDAGTWKAWTIAIGAATSSRGNALVMPLRIALTGETHGPELAGLLPLIPRFRVVDRLERAAGPG